MSLRLIRQQVIKGSFDELLKQAQTKDQIFLYEGEWDGWFPHLKGIIIRKKNQFLLNWDFIYQGEWDEWLPDSKGIIIKRNNQFLRNGKDLIDEGEWDWWSHSREMIMRERNQFLLNEKGLIYEGEWDEWLPHSKGRIIRKDNQFSLIII